MAIVVTGFGPFKDFKTNISSETVEDLKKTWNPEHGNLIGLTNIEVSYSAVKEVVKLVWEKNPRLVVHLGVHGETDVIVLESCSSNSGYCYEDVTGKQCDHNGHCFPPADDVNDVIQTKLNVDKIVSALKDNGISSVTSSNPGYYLCGYIYYNSLKVDSSRCLFVHVPPHEKASPADLSKAVSLIIQEALKQI